MAKKKDKTYRAGAYKRLSQDDGRGEVSNSIINQTELIKDYGKSHSEIEIVAEYDDDGYSGTNFDRPGFLREGTEKHTIFILTLIKKKKSIRVFMILVDFLLDKI